ncbi:MAG TPA: MBL fold metallo-hydrolase [Pyrodictium sp.]|nr:MBL fold metallo-hydrolase [Pyrodictium sp.]
MVRLKIVGADSFGARSLATVIEVCGLKIFVDPGVSFAPRRYGLPPHEVELKRVKEIENSILRELEDTDIIIITHYHYDHYLYRQEHVEAYKGKILLVKNPTQHINVNQRIRAHRLFKRFGVENLAKRIEYADSRTFNFDCCTIDFSPPVPHGVEGTRLGYVVMVRIRGEFGNIVVASDVQGPMSSNTLKLLENWKPDIIVLSGPPTYFEGYRVEARELLKGFRSLYQLANSAKFVIVDHHFARDKRFPKILNSIRKALGKRNLVCAAEYMGKPIEPLEAYRDELWKKATNSNRTS